MSYGIHPSEKLRELFEARPFQGAEPSSSKFLFVGLDANFAHDIETAEVFDEVCEYLLDGVAFWKSRGRHHPFLLPVYRGSGRPYHRRFAEIGFQPDHAEQVSFVEALHLPTQGSGSPPVSLLDPKHLDRLEQWTKGGSTKYVFIPKSVLAVLHQANRFLWLNSIPISHRGSLPVLREFGRTTIFSPYHFSYRFGSRTIRSQQLKDIGALIDKG